MSTVKGVRRTFILTLDRDRHHETLEMGTKRNRLCSASFLIGINIVFLASLSTTAELEDCIHAAGLLSAL